MISDFELDIQEHYIRTLMLLDGSDILNGIHSSGVLAFIEQAKKANELLRLIKENLKRNVIIHDDPKFKGRWIAIPDDAFDALRKETF